MLTEYRGLIIMRCTADQVNELPWANQDPAFERYARAAMAEAANNNLSFTFTAAGKIVMCGGLVIMSPGVAWVWLMAGTLIKKYPVAACGACLLLLKELAMENKIHRIQTAIYPAFERGIRFAEWLGFKKEGVMRKYSPDKQDYCLYAKIIEEF